MVEKISEDQETMLKRYAESSIQMGVGGELSIFYSAEEERAEVAQQWCDFGLAKGFFYLAHYFVPYNIEAMMRAVFKVDEVERLFKETVYDEPCDLQDTHPRADTYSV